MKIYCDKNKDKINETNKIYRTKNKDKINEKLKIYRAKNKDKINEKFDCACGGKFTHQKKSQHFKTKKHQAFISSI